METYKNLNGQNSTAKIPDTVTINESSFNEPQDIIEKLNVFFSTIIKLKTEHVSSGVNFDSALTEFVNIKVPADVKFRIPVMKHKELLSSIKSLNIAKATGLDGITPKILKSSAEIVCPILLEIINISLNIGQFPDGLKIAKLLPIHKGGAKTTHQIIDQFLFCRLFRNLFRNILQNIDLDFSININYCINLNLVFASIILVIQL